MYTYLFLQYLLLIFAAFSGHYISKDKHPNVWSAIIIVVFTFVEGSRFGRGIDYNVYESAWLEYAQHPLIFETFLFRILCKLIYNAGLPYQTLIYVTSFILIFGGVKFLRNFKAGLVYSLPLFIGLVYLGENLFRWYTALSLWLLVLDSWIGKKYKLMVFYIICCFGIHVMFLPYMLLFLILSVYKKFLFKPLTTIVLFIILAVVWENSYMKQLSSLVTLLLAQSDHYSAYADNAYEWVTASNRDDVVISITAYLSMLLTNIPVICIGRKYVSQHLQLLPYYNMYILAFALFPAMGKIELFSRYNQVMMIYYCIFAGIIFAFILKQVKLTRIPKYLIVLSILSCLNQIRITTFTYYACSQNKWCTLFIWDAHGRKSIDSELLKD